MRRLFRRKPRQPRSPKSKRAIPRSISITGRLLGLQAIGFIALALHVAPAPPVRAHEFNEVWQAALFAALAIASVVAGLGLLRLRPAAWNLAMLLEGVALLLALFLYLGERTWYIYLQMLFGIIVVLNLDQPELRHSFPTEIIEAQTETHKEHKA